jgi:hypothetical protein
LRCWLQQTAFWSLHSRWTKTFHEALTAHRLTLWHYQLMNL